MDEQLNRADIRSDPSDSSVKEGDSGRWGFRVRIAGAPYTGQRAAWSMAM